MIGAHSTAVGEGVGNSQLKSCCAPVGSVALTGDCMGDCAGDCMVDSMGDCTGDCNVTVQWAVP